MKISKFFHSKNGPKNRYGIGTKTYHLTIDAPDWLKEAIYDLHCGSLPSNYIYDLAHSFSVDYDNGNVTSDDDFHEWADGMIDVYNADLYQFAADNSSASWYDDESATDLIGTSNDPLDHIRAVQYSVALTVAQALYRAIEDNLDEDNLDEDD